MQERDGLAWLARKLAWGLDPSEWEAWQQLGSGAVIDRLVDPDNHGVDARPDPFADIEIDPEQMGQSARQGVARWIEHAITSPRPLETFMEFFWSDYFAVSIRNVRPQFLMFDHMNLLARHCLGNFSTLLREVTIDGAMLRFLDGAGNTAQEPNENYGRELLELYSVGVGNFTEDDVKAAARALTGWVVRRRDPEPRFIPRRHESRAQTLLGVAEVDDVDSTIDAVLAHPATAPRVVDKLASAILGPGYDPASTAGLAAPFARDWELEPVVRGLLEQGVAGSTTPSLIEPFAWYVGLRRIGTAAPQPRRLAEFFRTSGQIPMVPPNVGGFPDPSAYLSTSATIARFNFASHLAERSARVDDVVDMTRDLDGLAQRFTIVNGFSRPTRDALDGLSPGIERLAAALASPDLVVV